MLVYSWGMPLVPGLLLLLLAAVPAAAQGRLWRANLADSRDFLPGLQGNTPDTAWLSGPEPGRRWQWVSEGAWNGVLDRKDGGEAGPGGDSAAVRSSEILSARATQTLWAVPLPGTAFGAAWSGALDRNRHREPWALDARLGVQRSAFGFSWVQSLLPAQRSAEPPEGPGRPFLDAAVSLPDTRRQAFAWMLAGGRQGIWRAELGMRQEETDEEFSVHNLDSLGSGEEVEGSYSTRARSQRLLLRFPAAGGSVSWLGAYGTALPRRPEGEFWLCDSSRALDSRLAYARPGPRWGWEAWGRYQEAEAVTLGRRLPPGSEGMKRFHFARNHAFLWELGAEAGATPTLPGWQDGRGGQGPGGRGWRIGGGYRRLAWDSRPALDALDARSETLSYNRLGLSFIANLYGGLYKVSEIVEGRLAADLWEARGSWAWRQGPFAVEPGLSLYRTGFDLRAVGNTLSQRLISVDTAEAFRRSYRGYLLGVTPRLRTAVIFGGVRLEAEAAQGLPVHVSAECRGSSGGGEAVDGDSGELAAFRNAFEARARLVAGW